MVGLVFSKLSQADNIGYIIPGEEIDLFLDDIKDGRYDGKPPSTTSSRPSRTTSSAPSSSSTRRPQACSSTPRPKRGPTTPQGVGPDHEDRRPRGRQHGHGQGQGRPAAAVPVHVQKLAKDGKVPLTVVRQGKELKLDVPVMPRKAMLIESLQGRYPSYFVYGPLSSRGQPEFFAALPGRQPGSCGTGLIGSPLATRRGDRPVRGRGAGDGPSPMFPHKHRQGLQQPVLQGGQGDQRRAVKNLRHMVELLRDTKEKYTTISFDDRGSETIVFDHKEALAATEEVLTDNGIRQRQRRPDGGVEEEAVRLKQ